MGAKITIELTEDALDKAQRCADSWARLIRKYWGVRRLQLIFSTTGQALQQYEASARSRVATIYNNK